MSRPIPLTDPLSIAWIQWCHNEHIPANTVARRLATLRSLPGSGTATREDVEAWWTARTGHAPASRANDLANLRSFYKWCRRWEHRPAGDDPTLRIDPPKVPKGLPRPMSKADLNRLLAVLPPDLCRAVCLGAYGGLRVSEAASQDWADIDLELHRIRVLGKGDKTRLVGISVLLLDALLPNTGGNVVAAGGRPSSAGVLQRRVNRAIAEAGVHATFHQLRHRFGTMAVANGANLLAVSRAMGHASVTTTAIYVETSDAELDVIAAAVTR
jgi:integrase